MPFALVFIGLIMIVSGARDTHTALGKELTEDFTGPGNFLYWFAAIGVLGAVGSIPQFRKFSHYFMALIILAMFISNRGFFTKFSEAIGQPVTNPKASNNNYIVGNSDAGSAKAPTENLSLGNGVLSLGNIGTPESRENFNFVANIVKFFIWKELK